jgi:serine phosphatase RsbU (regulator of sigma subunit)/tetratricopeptide (TPR) repeat protein
VFLKTAKPNDPLRPFYLTHLATVYNNLGYLASENGETALCLQYYQKSLKIQQEVNDKNGEATSLNNIGLLMQRVGDVPKAVEYLNRSLKMHEEMKYMSGVVTSLNNLATIYQQQGDAHRAIEYLERSVKICEETGDKSNAATSLNNLGYMYKNIKDIDKAETYYNKSLKIAQELHDQGGIATAYNNLGSTCGFRNDVDGAISYYLKSLKIRETINDKEGIFFSLDNIANAMLDEKGPKLIEGKTAKDFAERALKISKELGFPENIMDAGNTLSKIYAKEKNWEKAFQMQALYRQMNDSVLNETNRKASLQKAFQYQYEKKAAADSVKASEEKKIVTLQLQKERTQRLSLYGGIVLIALFSAFMFNRFRVTRNQKHIIELKEKETQVQKNIIEEKHKEITDSINYAERIQRSFLASKELLDENLKNYFVFFKPKDVVSGDFYWAGKLINGNFMLATADSTGHGVPGAIMSLINVTSLEKAIEHHNNPAEILNHTRQIIIDRLKKDGSEEGGKDGMDCSLIAFDFEKLQLQVAAAQNPVWIVRKNEKGMTEFIEVKPDKMPVGKHDKDQETFTLHSVNVKKGDTIYTLTDGFPDQFGGPDGKKFMSKKLKNLLLVNQHLSIPQQKELLETTFKNWIGDLEQVDDVCVIGIRI